LSRARVLSGEAGVLSGGSVFHLITAAIVAAIGLVLGVRVLEPKLAFFPSAGESTTPRHFGIPYDTAVVTTADGERLRAWLLPHPTPRAVVVYFHGNGGNLSVWAPILAGIYERGYTVRAVDYRGYGASTGRPSERGLYRDVDAIVEWAWRETAGTSPIIYWGRSLGTTMAAYGCTVRPPEGLILESGFPNARAVLRSSPPLRFLGLFSTYRFPTSDFLDRAHPPVLIMHGEADRVVPFEAGKMLFEAIPPPKQFVAIANGDHNDASPADPETYWSAVLAFTSSLRTAR
jgi:fermentation-respiration switch protein FrsA (DUF1100 family)